MTSSDQQEHQTIRQHLIKQLEEKSAHEIIENSIDIEVRSSLNGDVRNFRLKFNISGGQGYLFTVSHDIETYYNDGRKTPIGDKPELTNKLEEITQLLETQFNNR